MSDLSYTSSSDPPIELAFTERSEAIRAGLGRLPWGFLGAVAIILTVHLSVTAMFPQPVAGSFIRKQAWTGLKAGTPAIIIAGDSRMQLGVNPDRLSERLTLPPGTTLNLAQPLGDSTTSLSAYRTFASRFAPRPVLLLGVSLFSINDGSSEMFSEEFMRSRSLRDRVRIVRTAEAIAAEFLPEKGLWELSISPITEVCPTQAVRYVPPIPASWNVGTWKPRQTAAKMQWVWDNWFAEPNLDGIRWDKLVADINDLQALGAQVVIVDMPVHPMVCRELAKHRFDQVFKRFHAKLDQFCDQARIPLLRYEIADSEPAHPDAIFMDLTHLNEAGAAIVTDRMAGDLARLIADGRIQLPRSIMPACRRHNTYASTDQTRHPGNLAPPGDY